MNQVFENSYKCKRTISNYHICITVYVPVLERDLHKKVKRVRAVKSLHVDLYFEVRYQQQLSLLHVGLFFIFLSSVGSYTLLQYFMEQRNSSLKIL